MSVVTLYMPDGTPRIVEEEDANTFVNQHGLLREAPVDGATKAPDPDPADGSDGETEDPDAPEGGDGGETDDPIVVAIRGLDAGDASLWTKGGKPQVGALEVALGYEVTAAERDAAWEIVQHESEGD